MDYSEKWGKDVDEAVQLALDDLGLKENQVMVTVIEEPAKGFLGLGSKLAKVRVEKLEGAAGDDDEEYQNSGNKKDSSSEVKAAHDFRKKSTFAGETKEASERRPREDRGNRRDNRDNRPRRDSRDSSDSGVEIPYDFDAREQLSEKPSDLVPAPDHPAGKFLEDVISHMNIEVTIEASENADCVYIEIDGPDAKTVIGKRGQTLDSLQYLTNLATNKDREVYKRAIIDVEGYRSRREKTLERLGVKLAGKVLKSGRSVKLEPMNPYERKVIHATLQSIDGISTRSEGEEPYRRVVIDRVR
jgi:spoIIIJ-associated protein